MGDRKDLAAYPPLHQFQRARLGELSPQFAKGCRIVSDVAHRLCAVNPALVSGVYALLPPLAQQIRCVLPRLTRGQLAALRLLLL